MERSYDDWWDLKNGHTVWLRSSLPGKWQQSDSHKTQDIPNTRQIINLGLTQNKRKLQMKATFISKIIGKDKMCHLPLYVTHLYYFLSSNNVMEVIVSYARKLHHSWSDEGGNPGWQSLIPFLDMTLIQYIFYGWLNIIIFWSNLY